jgi:hypothetical protein
MQKKVRKGDVDWDGRWKFHKLNNAKFPRHHWRLPSHVAKCVLTVCYERPIGLWEVHENDIFLQSSDGDARCKVCLRLNDDKVL